MQRRIRQLADAELDADRAARFKRVLDEALEMATHAAAARRRGCGGTGRPRGPMRTPLSGRPAAVRRWSRSTRRAHDRELPPGFGVRFQDVRRFPFGHQGRMLRVGDVPLSDAAGIAGLVASALPPANAADAAQVARAEAGIQAFLRDQGRHVFTERLLEGGVKVDLGEGQELVVALDLDMNQVHHLRAIETELTPVGQKRHHAVEADHEAQAGWRYQVENESDLTVTANVVTAFGAPLQQPAYSVQCDPGRRRDREQDDSLHPGLRHRVGHQASPALRGGVGLLRLPGCDAPDDDPPERPAVAARRDERAHGGRADGLPRGSRPAEAARRPGAFREQPRKLDRLAPVRCRPGRVDADAPGRPGARPPEAVRADPQSCAVHPGVGRRRPEPSSASRCTTSWTGVSAGPTTRTGATPDPKVIERADAFLSETSVMRWISDILGAAGYGLA